MDPKKVFHQTKQKKAAAWLLALGLLVVIFATSTAVMAMPGQREDGQASSMHPTFPLLDLQGENVLQSGQPVSTMKTCGECHDTQYVADHSAHSDLGLDGFPEPAPSSSSKTTDLEMNCFLCHIASPNNEARVETLEIGEVAWANTATLVGTGIVEQDADKLRYQLEAFSETGDVDGAAIQIQDPSSENCGQCHSTVHTDMQAPLILPDKSLENWRAYQTGQVFSGQRLSDSGLNLAGKDGLPHPFDIHAERSLSCTDCHYSLNNPVYIKGSTGNDLDHLKFDPRRLELGEYLERPVHELARSGRSPESSVPSSDLSEGCTGCHSLEATHTWLPYKNQHMEVVACETCHIPNLKTNAFKQIDWTALHTDGSPLVDFRGVDANGLVQGYEPVVLERRDSTGGMDLAPYNLVATWFWVGGADQQRVSSELLQTAWYESGSYHDEVLAVFDLDQNGELGKDELVLDSSEKAETIRKRLQAVGVENPQISGEIQINPINHSIVTGDRAVRECTTCHGESSKLTQPFEVSGYIPGGVMPEFVKEGAAEADGTLYSSENGRLYYRPDTKSQGVYILGHNGVDWIDRFGSLAFGMVLLGIAFHGTIRFLAAFKKPQTQPETKPVYMYGVYERLWHWLQTFTILGLLFTGLIIHKPETFGIFSFRYVVLVHNILAAILVVNAGLSLFYHLVSGEIRQYIPRPAGFFDQAVVQGMYYIRGIFKGERHPFEKTPEKKLNPLQQATYFGILNILLPLQILTGVLMWGVQQWPDLTARAGGLPFLAPFHTLVAWTFASFIIMHVYLTTTGHTASASIRAMMMGWDELETQVPAEEVGD